MLPELQGLLARYGGSGTMKNTPGVMRGGV
jgi:hypothetical protein